jgi:hypothetical protein
MFASRMSSVKQEITAVVFGVFPVTITAAVCLPVMMLLLSLPVHWIMLYHDAANPMVPELPDSPFQSQVALPKSIFSFQVLSIFYPGLSYTLHVAKQAS